MSTFRQNFDELCRMAMDLDLKGRGSVSDFEHVLIEVIDLTRHQISNAGLAEVEAVLFDVGVGTIRAPYETLLFLMHGLRLAAVLSSLEDYARSLPEGRERHDFAKYVSDCRDALNDDWQDRDIYESFRSAR